ncbi:MAG: M23 family metallopeptidase [Bacteroidetes bacterium]|jgi:murein DD-endopeptidase MepM/ murein hydrolase activator NlpD|nr:M23 family metallopeptidase [Bacteroidota bacterium]
MSKIKYKFNTKSLTYERDTVPMRKRIWQALSYLATGLVFATITILLAYKYLDSPKEKQLQREIAELTLQYELLNTRIGEFTEVLDDIQDRDNNIYRTIFEADSIPESIRKAGFGGVDRYKKLQGFNNSDLMVETTKRLDRISKQLYIQSKSFDEVVKLVKGKEQLLASIPAIQPISNADLRHQPSGFGWRTHPIYKTPEFHPGMDFAAPQGTEIHATGDGTIERADAMAQGYGNHVVINHGYGYRTLYGHMVKFVVRPGQKVKRGQLIGYVGSTGLSTAPHVHYEVMKNGDKMNPINYYYNDLTPEQYQKLIELSSQSSQSFD